MIPCRSMTVPSPSPHTLHHSITSSLCTPTMRRCCSHSTAMPQRSHPPRLPKLPHCYCRRTCPRCQGELNVETGRLDMMFDADFVFSIGSLYVAPPLKVATTLTTERSSGALHAASGSRLSSGAAT